MSCESPVDQNQVLVSVLMPCLNEARTLAECILQAHAGCQAASLPSFAYEILIADNGSTDGSTEIAIANGARVVPVKPKGYGEALRGGIAVAHGKYVVMGDSDSSYDFREIPRFLSKLRAGNDLVMGNRFAGGIMHGAMPWHHRYVGNPLLSLLGRVLYKNNCRDWHCGLRGFDREKILLLGLKSSGMEFASEIVIRCCQAGYVIGELPVKLYPDGRGRRSHLRSFRDGIRHLCLMFLQLGA
jgi:glycosyltransferase involved in cell wall biosynthesis